MKAIFLIGFYISIFYVGALAQCSNGGLKIQSDACEAPKNLKVNSIDCSQMTLSWSGIKDKIYTLKTSVADPSKSEPEIKTLQVNTDRNGNCKAVIQVKEGMDINWTVQTICTVTQSNIYSAEVSGEQVHIPFCKDVIGAFSNMITVYPNPTRDYLTMEYSGAREGPIKLQVLNMGGKIVLSKTLATMKKKSSYRLDISRMLPGTYLLKTFSEKDGSNQAKFVKLVN